MDTIPNIVLDIILLNLSVRLNTLPKEGFMLIIASRIWSLSHSLKNNTNIKNDIYVQLYWEDVNDFFPLCRFKLVVNATYLTWLHRRK